MLVCKESVWTVPARNWPRCPLVIESASISMSRLMRRRCRLLALEEDLNAALHGPLPSSLTRRLGRKGYESGIDMVEIPYYGQPAQIEEEIRCGKVRAGTTRFHAYVTGAVVHHGQRYEIALTFVWADASGAPAWIKALPARGSSRCCGVTASPI